MSDIEGRSRDFGILGQPKVEPKAPKQSGRNRSAEPSNKSNDPKAATHPASRHQPKTRQPMNPFDDSYETFPPFSHSDTSRKSVESGKRGRSPAAAAHPPFAVSQNSLTESGNPFKGPFDDSRDASPSPSSDPSTSTKSNEPGTRGRARGGRPSDIFERPDASQSSRRGIITPVEQTPGRHPTNAANPLSSANALSQPPRLRKRDHLRRWGGAARNAAKNLIPKGDNL
ncbi:MAG: hypothetical protein CYPHOPRED_003630 [Cyphobasidiales sp. Tagirdzhanova-0007]|nr:MAG: hypothetical protein CYPHOPRED_003630 [Cyphobasidiales sp. Tagirdzhanova-0007]